MSSEENATIVFPSRVLHDVPVSGRGTASSRSRFRTSEITQLNAYPGETDDRSPKENIVSLSGALSPSGDKVDLHPFHHGSTSAVGILNPYRTAGPLHGGFKAGDSNSGKFHTSCREERSDAHGRVEKSGYDLGSRAAKSKPINVIVLVSSTMISCKNTNWENGWSNFGETWFHSESFELQRTEFSVRSKAAGNHRMVDYNKAMRCAHT
ncbi:hypothetical protein K503DRAFT_783458 [Rhizopogon vinicolor AM-OR11-026]|uniref:Uncharacterized protein n=1 Tax=Rhizopogon vinicolor AM-OR11-026 TaxID=1314800 RepID=A0A1B7MYI6_9AGAM|nr:hypothetical protein K503DRAFT_783458 [Rhizopogon vinicolor AM-OR11-026]